MKIAGMLIALLCFVIVTINVQPVFAADSAYGTIVQVTSGDRVVMRIENDELELLIAGIDLPNDPRIADQATQFVSDLVLRKNARMRVQGPVTNGVIPVRLFTDDPDPDIGIQDVAIELVRAGLVRRQAGFDFKYGELEAAESEARDEQRGLWDPNVP